MSMMRNMEHVKQTQFDLLELTNTMFEMKKNALDRSKSKLDTAEETIIEL